MKKKFIIVCLFLSIVVCSSCSDFLKEFSQDLTYANRVSDLNEILVEDGYMDMDRYPTTIPSLGTEDSYYFPWIHIMDDDARMHFRDVSDSREGLMNFFTWAQYPYMQKNEVVKDDTWKRLYKHISVVNVVLSKCDDVEGSVEAIDKVRGECHFLRASFYYFLINFYAKPYSKATAASDLGVPIKLTEYIEDKYFSRNSVKEVYELIISDLDKAANYLKGKKQNTIYRADYCSVKAFQSRIYLYMEEYDNAIAAADEVIEGNYSLLNYNGLTPPVANSETYVSTTYKDSPETIFSQAGNDAYNGSNGTISPNSFGVSNDLIDIYSNENDLRPKFFFYEDYSGLCKFLVKFAEHKTGVVSSIFLLRLPEVLLNKAEALAIKGESGKAKELLIQLANKRMKSGYTPTIEATDGEELVNYVRDERRRELCFEGHRWFDLRRYAVNSKYPYKKEIVHEVFAFDANWNVVSLGSYKLNKYGNEPAYVIPIPKHVIEYNRGEIVDNEVRPERAIIAI